MAVLGCVFLSGAASLALEVVWTRLLRLVFGSTTLAISTILVAYMLGLGLGGLLGGRVAERLRNGVRTYGWMEIAIALYALVVPAVLGFLPRLDGGLFGVLDFWPAAFVRFAIVLLILLLPTVCMGATLPVLVSALVRQPGQIARRVGLLYGVNTLGAVCGVFVATFVFFPTVGLWWTNTLGAILDLIVGALAIAVVAPRVAASFPLRQPASLPEEGPVSLSLLAKEGPGEVRPPTAAPIASPPSPPRDLPATVALTSYAIVGFTALSYEVCWTRALSMIVGSSVYAFATMLMAFLSGIALGSILAHRWFDRLERPLPVYGVGLALLGCAALGTFLSFRGLPGLFPRLFAALGPSGFDLVSTGMLVASAAMLAPTLVLGALFPLLVRAVSGAADAGRSVGAVYFANTIGSASGAFATGFLLIPWIGLRHTMAVAMALNFAAAALVLATQRQWRGRTPASVAAGLGLVAVLIGLFPPAWDTAALARGVYRFPADELDVGVAPMPFLGLPAPEILYYREGINTTVSVHREGGELNLRVNGKVDAGSGRDMATQVLLGQVPLLFGPPASRVLIVGLASGVTAGSAALHDVQQIDVVELEPAMIEVSHFFDHINHRPLERANVRVIADDGRALLARTQRQYDVIISEPSNPWITGAASLFTREFFRAARGALVPGGRLLQWVQLYGLQPETFATIVAAMRSELPYIYGFIPRAGDPDLLLLGMDEPLRVDDLPRWSELPETIRNDLRRIDTASEAELWSLLRFVPSDFDAVARSAAAINSDDNMLVELRSPWALYDQGLATANWQRLTAGTTGEKKPSAAAAELASGEGWISAAGIVTLIEASGRPLSAAQLGDLALAYLQRGDPDLARRLVELGRERGGAAAIDVAAVVLRHQEEDSEAALLLADLDRILVSHPQAAAALYRRALVRLQEDNGRGALEDIDAYLQQRPDDLRARYVRLKALIAVQDAGAAYEEAQRLLASPHAVAEPSLLSEAAQAAAELGHYEEAIRLMRGFLQRWSEYPMQWTLLAKMYRAAGRADEARQAEHNASIADRNLVLRLHQRALRAERVGLFDEAIGDLRTAWLIDEEYAPALYDLKRIMRRRGLSTADLP
jgi:spermidine synthase